MSQNNRDLRATVGYKVDSASVAQATQSIRAVDAAYRSAGNAALASNLAAVRGAQQAVSANNALAASIDRVNASQRAGAALSGARGVAGTAGGLASLVGGSQAASAASSILGLTAQLGPLGLAAGVATVAIKAASDAEASRAEAAKNFADAVAATAGLTSDELQKQIDAERDRIAAFDESKTVLQDFRDRIQLQNDAYNFGVSSQAEFTNNIGIIARELHVFSGGAIKLSDDLNYMVSNVNLLDSAIGEAQTRIDASSKNIAFLGVQMGTAAVAANDAAVAEEEYTKALKEGEEERTKALKSASDAINAGLQDLAAAQKAVEEATARTAEAQQALTDALADHRDNQRRIILDQYEAEAKALETFNEGQAEARADNAKAVEQLNEDHARRLLQINERYTQANAEAVGNRDALAAYRAKVARDTELKEENRAYADQKKALDKALAEQLQVLQKRYDQQLRAAREAAQKAIAAEQDRYDKQYRNLTDALNKALAAEQFANNRLEAERSLNAMRAQYYAGLVEVANKRVADSAAAMAVSLTQSALLIEGVSGFGGKDTPGGNFSSSASSFSTRPSLGSMKSSAFNKAVRMDSLSGGGRRAGGIVFAPVINGARMTKRDFDRMSDDWFDRLHRMA